MLRTKELFFILIFINSSVKSNPSSLSFAGFQKCTINLNLLSRIEFKLDIAENLVSTQAENMNYLKLTIYLGYNFTASLSFHAPNKIHLDGKFCSVIIFMEKRTPEFYRYFIKNNLLTSRTLTSYIFIRHYSFPEKFEWTHPARKFHWVISLLYKRRRVEIAGTRILMECPLCKDGFIDVPNFTEILRDHIPPKEWDVSTGKNILVTHCPAEEETTSPKNCPSSPWILQSPGTSTIYVHAVDLSKWDGHVSNHFRTCQHNSRASIRFRLWWEIHTNPWFRIFSGNTRLI